MAVDRSFAAVAGIPATSALPKSRAHSIIDGALTDFSRRELLSSTEVCDLLLDLRGEVA